ncbi:MAG: fumarate hydratase [Candidatus Omnitrophica bacterium]|nr:fumarate hydratase [Candidatus Omnitrophota bacterium]
MRIISANQIKDAVSDLCIRANIDLRKDVLQALKRAYLKEKNRRAKKILNAIIKNASIAKREKLAICQDSGLPVVFAELGQDVRIKGDLKSAIRKGVESGYKKGHLRNSIVDNPLLRGRSSYRGAVIHLDLVKGNNLKLTVLPKGFGCENKSQVKMFNPTAKIEEIKNFIIDVVKTAGADACPPFVVGVGIGGTADYASFLAKKALLRSVRVSKYQSIKVVAKLEQELLREINQLNIGPMGLGGRATALAVNVETYLTHIAGLPVAVNISCHALRSASRVL